MSNYFIREINSDEVGILKDMLYEAIFQPAETNLLPREVIEQPELSVFINNWGQPDDLCLVAESDGKIVGAVWTRILAVQKENYAVKMYKNNGFEIVAMLEEEYLMVHNLS